MKKGKQKFERCYLTMETIRSYATIEQSRKLAEFLPLESADYCWGIDKETLHYNNSPYPCAWKDYTCKEYYIPCWSLASLLGVLPNYQLQTKDDGIGILCSCKGKFNIVTADNPVDACVAMIEKLHELNLL